MTAIAFKGVTKIFGSDPAAALERLASGQSKDTIRRETGATIALHDVSLDIEASEVFVVMGLSGSGKSTLVRLVNRLIEPTAGDILVDGQPTGGLSRKELRRFRRESVAMVFQRFALFPHMRVADNVAYGLRVRGGKRREIERRTAESIEAVGLTGYETAYPDELSGGMQQRVGLARALATDPKILLMDEPFGALDPVTRRDMQDLLLGLQERLKKTIVFITHDMHEAARLGDRIAILKDGALIQEGPPKTIIREPADDYVRAFIRALPQADDLA